MANGLFGGGSGTQENPYIVEDKLDLYAVNDNLSAHYRQSMDISLHRDETSIDNFMIGEDTPFTGSYDGQGHSISGFGLFYNGGNAVALGLFSRIDGATLRGIRMVGAGIDAYGDHFVPAGILVGLVTGVSSISASSVSASYVDAGSGGTGGLIGKIDTTSGMSEVYSCYAQANVTANVRVGGFVGTATGVYIINSYGGASTFGSSLVGGFVGELTDSAVVRKCYSSGSVSVSVGVAGGFVGVANDTEGSITNNYALVDLMVYRYGVDLNSFGPFAGSRGFHHETTNYYLSSMRLEQERLET